jgi:hypothetical protein
MSGLAFLIPLIGVVAACAALGVNRASYYRAQQPKPEPKPRLRPARALSDEERAHVLATLDSEPFMNKAPAQVYASLLEDGEYLCSPSTMYRILADADQVRERRAQRCHPEYKKPQLVAKAPNQVWSWDTTKLPGPAKGMYFVLYVVLDIFVSDGWTPRSRGAMRSGRLPGCASTTRPSHAASSSIWWPRSVSSRISVERRDERARPRPHAPDAQLLRHGARGDVDEPDRLRAVGRPLGEDHFG